jgi:hypothetical protein
MEDLERAIISTEFGPRSSAGLTDLRINCGWQAEGEKLGENCFLPLGHMKKQGTNLRTFICDAVKQHLTTDIQRREGIDFICPTEQETDDLIAVMFSDSFIDQPEIINQ